MSSFPEWSTACEGKKVELLTLVEMEDILIFNYDRMNLFLPYGDETKQTRQLKANM